MLSNFITNFNNNKKDTIKIMKSKKCLRILSLLQFLLKYKIIEEHNHYYIIKILKNNIKHMKLISKPSLTVFKSYNELKTDPRLKGGLQFYILTNSEHGFITSMDALMYGVGGKVLILVECNRS